MKIDCYASERHFVDHASAVYLALPRSKRGDLIVSDGAARDPAVVAAARLQARSRGIRPVDGFGPDRRPVLVCSYGDMKMVRAAGRGPIALIEHGIGQSYSNAHPSFPGGKDRDAIELFLSPNATAAARDRERYPRARVEVVGSPRLDTLPRRAGGARPVIAVSGHWDCAVAPESRSALFRPRPGYTAAVAELAKHHQLIGHGHPRAWIQYERWYRANGIEPVEDLDEVFRRADLYVCDNSSSMFEFAATGRPVVVLNSRIYRRAAHHGLRFWDAAGVGVNVNRPAELAAAIAEALEDPAPRREARERALDIVYGYRTGAAERAAGVLLDWAGERGERARNAPARGPGPQLSTPSWTLGSATGTDGVGEVILAPSRDRPLTSRLKVCA